MVSLPKASTTRTDGALGDRTGLATGGMGGGVEARSIGVISSGDSTMPFTAVDGVVPPLGKLSVVPLSENRDEATGLKLRPLKGLRSEGPTIGTDAIESEDKSPGSISNLTFRMLFLRKDPPGVGAHAPGGAGVCRGKVFALVRFVAVGVANIESEAGGVRSGGVELGRGGGTLVDGGGVSAHAPGGLGVFIVDRFPSRLLSRLRIIGVLSSSIP